MMRRSGPGVSCVLLASLLAVAPAVEAQEPRTRAELLRQQREARQQTLEPYEPNALERAMHVVEEDVLPLLQRDGVYAKLGSLTTGSGFAYGVGFRDRALVHGLGQVDLWAAASLQNYWTLEARGAYPLSPGGAVQAEGFVRRYAYASEEFFGLGPDSRRRDLTTYRNRGHVLGGRLTVRPAPLLHAGVGLSRLAPHVRSRHDDDDGDDDDDNDHRDPSLRDRFGALPGLGDDLVFHELTGFVEIDYRQPKNARRGGLYRLDVSRYDDRGLDDFDFTRLDLDLRQYASILAERRVFAARLHLATTDTDTAVPFYLQPTLGGNTTLRGFRAYRFRGPHAILLQGEYRWEVWAGFEGALFVDAGKVALRRRDLDFRDLETNYGFGFRFNTNESVILRIDAAFGSRDGRHLHVVFGGIF